MIVPDGIRLEIQEDSIRVYFDHFLRKHMSDEEVRQIFDYVHDTYMGHRLRERACIVGRTEMPDSPGSWIVFRPEWCAPVAVEVKECPPGVTDSASSSSSS